jgi:hypothetical protein
MQRIPPETLIKFETSDSKIESGTVISDEVRSGERVYLVRRSFDAVVVEVPANRVKSVIPESV